MKAKQELRVKNLVVALLLIISAKASAWCENQSQVGIVEYKINSSYFGSLTAQELDRIIMSDTLSAAKNGYLMLEYHLDQNEIAQITDPKAKLERQTYNRWLAERRIKRVKDYLVNKELQLPVLTRLRTTHSDDAKRSVFIHSCETVSEPSAFKKLAD